MPGPFISGDPLGTQTHTYVYVAQPTPTLKLYPNIKKLVDLHVLLFAFIHINMDTCTSAHGSFSFYPSFGFCIEARAAVAAFGPRMFLFGCDMFRFEADMFLCGTDMFPFANHMFLSVCVHCEPFRLKLIFAFVVALHVAFTSSCS